MRYLPARRDDAPNLIFWLPTFAGVLVLVAALLFTVLRLYTPPEQADSLPQPIAPFQPIAPASFEPLTPASFLPEPVAAGPASTPATRDDVNPGGSGANSTARPSPKPSRTVKPPASTPTPIVTVRGTYRVLNTYGGAFIAEVLISNTSGQDRDWTVTLRFPSNVGHLVTSWVEGAPQATLTNSGQTYTWRSGVPVPAGSSVPLRFHFERSGTGDYPSSCTTNGTACTIR